MRTISIGEVLWDVFGETEFLGGAPLNFSANLERLGNSAALLTAVGNDVRGDRAVEQMRSLGLNTDFVQIVADQPTGTAVVTTDSSGSASFVIERPAAFDLIEVDDKTLALVGAFCPEWIYFGTLAQTQLHNEELLLKLLKFSDGSKRFYDMNLRTGHWDLDLVQRLSRIATVLKLNDVEAELLFKLTFKNRPFDLEVFCHYWSSTYGISLICVTLGSDGCAIFIDGALQTFPGYHIKVADTVGAGDAFAAAFLHGLHLGWRIDRIAPFANALGAHVASQPGATPPWTLDDVELIASSTGVRILN